MLVLDQELGLRKREAAIAVLVPWATFVLTGLFFFVTLNPNYLNNLFAKP